MMTPATGFQKLRFHADDGSEFPEWKETEIKDIITIFAKKVNSDSDLPILTSSKANGIQYQDEHFSKNQQHDIDGYNVVPWGYCTYRNRSDGTDFTFNINKLCSEGIVSKFYPVFTGRNTDTDFLATFLNNEPKTVRKIAVTAKGTGQKVLSISDLQRIAIIIPSLPEQQKIAAFLSAYDKKISLQRERVETLKEQKKGLLQKMFPKKGETVPELRFPGFTGAWEQRKAIDIADYSKGNGYSKGDLTDAGTPIILYGRLYTKYQFAISEVDTFAVPRNGAVYSQGNEVIVPASGETAEDIARASAVEKSGVLLGGDLNILRPFDFINPLFLALAISNGEPQKELAKKAQGKSVVHIHNTDIQEVTIAYPSRTEQDRIVSVFRQLDNLITLHQRKLETMQEIKKGLLQQMFV